VVVILKCLFNYIGCVTLVLFGAWKLEVPIKSFND
jgi:hypothetical protein